MQAYVLPQATKSVLASNTYALWLLDWKVCSEHRKEDVKHNIEKAFFPQNLKTTSLQIPVD